jgi:hypothetical protein
VTAPYEIVPVNSHREFAFDTHGRWVHAHVGDRTYVMDQSVFRRLAARFSEVASELP